MYEILDYGCAILDFFLCIYCTGGGLFMLNEDVLKEFLFDCKMRKLSERTIKSYRNNNLRFYKFLESEYQITELEETYSSTIKGYVEYLTNQNLKETYVNSILKCFKAYFNYCVNESYITTNPMDKVKHQKEQTTIINTFSNNEVKKLITFYNGSRFLPIRNRLIMVILLDTGIRNSELCNLKVTDIRDTYINIVGKGNKVRHVPITAIINKHLIRYFRTRTEYIRNKYTYDTEYLLLSQKGKRLTPETIERIVLDAGKCCNIRKEIRISPHTCRHYFAQAQLKNGCDLYTVSRLLGHSNTNITKIYLQSLKDEELMDMAVNTSPLMNL